MTHLEVTKAAISKVLHIVDEIEITETSNLVDLGADSLDLVEIILEIENAYNIDIDDSELDNLKSVQDIINYLEETK